MGVTHHDGLLLCMPMCHVALRHLFLHCVFFCEAILIGWLKIDMRHSVTVGKGVKKPVTWDWLGQASVLKRVSSGYLLQQDAIVGAANGQYRWQ